MANDSLYPWPPLEPGGPAPIWDGSQFRVGSQRLPVLQYSLNDTAWDAGLTDLHEQTASSDHPIDLASRQAAIGALQASLPRGARFILEVGSSSGFLLPLIRQAFPGAAVIGSDAFPEALFRLARQERAVPLLQFDLTRCPLPDASLDAVVALNVLEHIENDALALREIHRVLKPGGVAYLEVPAGPGLYDIYDEMLRHHRRYRASGLKRLARAAGLTPERCTHLGCLVFPLFAAAKKRNAALAAANLEAKAAAVARSISATRRSALLGWAFAVESWLGQFVRYPFGIRCTCVLRKH